MSDHWSQQSLPSYRRVFHELEVELLEKKWRLCGVDEVGRGCLAGPVYAGCVLWDPRALWALPQKQQDLIQDSKALSSVRREEAVTVLRSLPGCLFAVGHAVVEEIDSLGISRATWLAVHRAVEQVFPKNANSRTALLLDGPWRLPSFDQGPQFPMVEGDRWLVTVSAASIVAKVARDRWMVQQADSFPGYGFERNKGYGTFAHKEALQRLGVCSLHRRSFKPCQRMS